MIKKITLVGMCLSCLLTAGCACSKKEDEEKQELPVVVEASNEVVKEQIIEGIRFKNASLIVNNGMSSFRVTLENTITTVKKIEGLTIRFKAEDGHVIKELFHYDFDNMKKGDTKDITFTISLDLSQTKEIEYILEEV